MESKSCQCSCSCSEKSPVALILVAVVVVLAFFIYPGSAYKQSLATDLEAIAIKAECVKKEEQAIFLTSKAAAVELPEGVRSVNFPTGVVTLQSKGSPYTIRVELAESIEQLSRGLMYRTGLAENDGMLFVFDWEQDGGFWMYNMHFSLSIAFVDVQGTILEIVDLEPCASPYEMVCNLDTYYPKEAYRYALEMNKGYFARNNITVGDTMKFIRH